MKRLLGLLLLLGTLLAVLPHDASAYPHGRTNAGVSHNDQGVVLAGERRGFFFWRRQFMPRQQRPDAGRFERKPASARFWGGPYWGYGARLGHPCNNCRSVCTGSERSVYCDRCRMRCGW